jgi:hypothetical protein
VQRIRKLEQLLDGQFTVTGVSFGIDSFIGRVPGVGDLTTGALGLYLIQQAKRCGISKFTLARMYTKWGSTPSSARSRSWGDIFGISFKLAPGTCAC